MKLIWKYDKKNECYETGCMGYRWSIYRLHPKEWLVYKGYHMSIASFKTLKAAKGFVQYLEDHALPE